VTRTKHYSRSRISRTIRKYTVIEQAVAVVPEHTLRIVAVEDAYSLLDHMIEQEARSGRRVERFPYWAEVWPAALALACWLCTSERAPRPGTALELGCGLGVVGIVMARLGWTVEATDFVEDALIFTARNASLNGALPRHRVGYLDWRNPLGDAAPCIDWADVLYERKNHPYLARVLRNLLLPGGWFYASDPARPPARDFVRLLRDQGYEHSSERMQVRWRSTVHSVDIHRFHRPSADEASAE